MIHCYQFDGLNIVLDCYSGSIHMVDKVAYDMIQWYETEPAEEVISKAIDKHGISREDAEECIADIDDLKNAGKLYAPDKYEHLAKDFRKKNIRIKALCLHVAHTCNLNCSYCFASQGKYHGERAIMSYEVGKRAIDFLIENSGFHKNLDIDFFGGEPLMNWDVCKKLVEYGREQEKIHNKNIRFTLTTNGVLLDDEVTEFANREMHNVVLSLDGRKEVNDRFRVDYAGHGSYDKIVPNFQQFVKKRGNLSYYMRGTFTHYNTDFVNDIKQMLDLGFTELSMEPVVTDPSSPSAITKEDLPIIFEQYEELARLMVERYNEGRPFTFYHYMLDLTCGPCIYKRIAGCGSGTEYLAVTPWGDLYPCHQFVGDEAYKMGSIYDGVQNLELQDKFASCNAYSRPECKDCWAKLYCSGGCAANAYHASGSINGIYEMGCDIFRKRIECAIAVKLLTSGLEQPGQKEE
ncbi:MAG: thioether cross-link-forming SCIFF peptide maturase [Clostridiales bacterium]|nr:thioether cross-link-forming SCIFF peptide maturase [Clostridiales bacterium]